MTLKWENYSELANRLSETYPQTDLSDISYAEVTKMITSLSDFDDALIAPDEGILDAILTCWTDIEYPEENDNVPASDID